MDSEPSPSTSSLFRPYRLIDCLTCSFKLWFAHLTSITFLTLLLLLPALVFMSFGGNNAGYLILAISLLFADAAFSIGFSCVEAIGRFPSFAILKLLFSKNYFFKTLALALLQFLFQWVGTLILVLAMFQTPAPFDWILGTAFGAFFIFCMIAISLAQSVWIWEGEFGGNALARSFRLVKPSFGRAFEVQTSLFLLKLGVSYILLITFVMPDVNAIDIKSEEFIELFATSVPLTLWFSHLLITPVNSIATTLLYFHLRHSNQQEPAPNLNTRLQDIMLELQQQNTTQLAEAPSVSNEQPEDLNQTKEEADNPEQKISTQIAEAPSVSNEQPEDLGQTQENTNNTEQELSQDKANK